jgi:hypothetical protein
MYETQALDGGRNAVVPGLIDGLIPCRCIIERLLVAKQRGGGARRGVSCREALQLSASVVNDTAISGVTT